MCLSVVTSTGKEDGAHLHLYDSRRSTITMDYPRPGASQTCQDVLPVARDLPPIHRESNREGILYVLPMVQSPSHFLTLPPGRHISALHHQNHWREEERADGVYGKVSHGTSHLISAPLLCSRERT